MGEYKFRDVREKHNENITDKKDKITQKDMADFCHIGKSTISRIERGEIEPSLIVLIGYADKFNVSMDYLLGRSDTENIDNSMINASLGLSDKAIETLKFFKMQPDDCALVIANIFLENKYSSLEFFNDIFNFVSVPYGVAIGKDNQAYWDVAIANKNIINTTTAYIQNDVQPKLITYIKDLYKAYNQKEIKRKKSKRQK